MNKSGFVVVHLSSNVSSAKTALSQPGYRGVNGHVIHDVPKACWFV